MVIRQGDVFWAELDNPTGSSPGYRHPLIIVQNNMFNDSKISTVVACALTSNVRLAKMPGNVLLSRGEADLPKESVVNVSQILTIDKHSLGIKIGSLSHKRVQQIIDGLKLLLEPLD